MSQINEQQQRRKKVAYTLKIKPSEAVRCSGRRIISTYRTEFMRDRDRVLYCKAFRRLAGKAQVFISGVDDHKRTRLTHTLEVSQIARSVAEPLNLDVNLVEAIALGHDLGHTPYGHVGERTLHEIMTPQENHVLGTRCPLNIPISFRDSDEEAQACRDRIAAAYGDFLGFKHNLQSIVVAMKLERNYEEVGLDLTNYTLYGIQAHSGGQYKPRRISNHDCLGYYRAYLENGCRTADGKPAWSLEGMLVAEADEIAQRHHDVEDALLGGLITPAEVVKIIRECFREFKPFKKLTSHERRMLNHPENYDLGEFVSLISRILINMMVNRLTLVAAYHMNCIGADHKVSGNNFGKFRAAHDPKDDLFRMVFSYSYTPEEAEDENGFAKRLGKFQNIINQRVLSSYDIQKADAQGKYIITKLFQAYYTTPQQLPDHCVYEMLSAYHELDRKAYLTDPKSRERFWKYSEKELREKARKEGIGSVRQLFSDMFANRGETMDVEELMLMRVICNHIAGMTDLYAHKVYEEMYS